MTNCGELGWVTDKERGYRYQATHPVTGKPWPPIPQTLLDLWREVADHPQPPQACLVNFYSDKAKMGQHQDRDESDFSAPSCRSRSATTACSASAARNATTRPNPSACVRRCGRARRRRAGSPSTASTASIPHLDAPEEWRPHQPDAAAGDETVNFCGLRNPSLILGFDMRSTQNGGVGHSHFQHGRRRFA